MRTSKFLRSAATLASAIFVAAGCGGGGFEPASKIQGLRVLALQKEPAYAHPGETVQMKLLYWDGKGSEGSPRNVTFNFFQCDDPPGDLYYACWDRLTPVFAGRPPSPGGDASVGDDASLGDGGAGDASEVEAGTPSEGAPVVNLSVVIPPREGIVHPRVPIDYGLRYIFFTACAGHLGPIDPGSNGLPFGCLDDQNQKLGPDDFVPGYSAIYVYDELRNANPIVDPVLKTSFAADLHVARCTEGDRGRCPTFDVQPIIDIAASAEDDVLGKDANGATPKEQLWVTYLSTAGDFTTSIRLVNDATTGPNPDYGTKFRAPASAATVHLFGIVHDNRGGVAWAQVKVIVD